MQLAVLRSSVLMLGALITTQILYPQATSTKAAQSAEIQGIPARATPADYQAHAKAGTVTIAAEFIGHFVRTPDSTLTTDDYIVVETALFGDADGRIKLSTDNFSLRVNGKKAPLPSQPYGMVTGSLKDPDWEPPASSSAGASKSKTSLGGGGGGGQNDSNSPPPPVHIPIEVQRAMAQKVQKASLAEGERALPQAGLLFFQFRGKTSGIRSVELIYSGPAGQATLALQP